MRNKDIAKRLTLLAALMELSGANAFKVKAITNGAGAISKLSVPLERLAKEETEALPGIGKSLSNKIAELNETGKLAELDTYIAQVPPGVVDMLSIKGLSTAKIKTIWKELQIETVADLYAACKDNRLMRAKGFGAKSQDEIAALIEFKMASSGQILWARANEIFKELEQELKGQYKSVTPAGEYRRKLNTVRSLDIMALSNKGKNAPESAVYKFTAKGANHYTAETEAGIPINIMLVKADDYGNELLEATGPVSHADAVKAMVQGQYSTEEEIYNAAGLSFIVPEMRDYKGAEIELAKAGKLPQLITDMDLHGAIHNHSTYSDGVNTLQEMADYCREVLGLSYFGISDHSKTAFYANGLKEDRLLAQMEEVDALNAKGPKGFKIFKGIESDILNDGSLDFDNEILGQLDYVVASVHSGLGMDEVKATKRLVKAVENKYTTVLGHMTGRQLLIRSGYPVNHATVIDACAANGVVIEINANPLRLDMDWTWVPYALNKGVMISINPDAHSTTELHFMQYGLNAARKGGLTAGQCLNAMDLKKIEAYFKSRK